MDLQSRLRSPSTVVLDDLEERTFRFFWDTAHPANGLVPDRYPEGSISSIAAVGFALTAYGIGAERGYVSRADARKRVLTTLRFFRWAPQGPEPSGKAGHKGFFYHFLEGLTDYARWGERIDYRRKHRPLRGPRSPWCDPRRVHAMFARLFERFADSILVVSYRSDGIPSVDELAALLGRFKRHVQRLRYGDYRYVLSTNARSGEVLLIGR